MAQTLDEGIVLHAEERPGRILRRGWVRQESEVTRGGSGEGPGEGQRRRPSTLRQRDTNQAAHDEPGPGDHHGQNQAFGSEVAPHAHG